MRCSFAVFRSPSAHAPERGGGSPSPSPSLWRWRSAVELEQSIPALRMNDCPGCGGQFPSLSLMRCLCAYRVRRIRGLSYRARLPIVSGGGLEQSIPAQRHVWLHRGRARTINLADRRPIVSGGLSYQAAYRVGSGSCRDSLTVPSESV